MKNENFVKLLFLLFSVLSCNLKQETGDMNYFNFDDLEYYHKAISSDEILKEYDKMRMSKEYDKKFFKILEGGYPENINNFFANELLDFGYERIIISKSKYKDINNFFSKKNCDEFKKSACEPIYRDILIFKKGKRIVGIAKICFRCQTAFIIGTKKNWDYFGECKDYEKLRLLIN